ncbi:heparinase II/III family protein [Pontiellaceae bacterium B12219]|nr:heparinase II/III family protein [Pontiellaceae bacterium B12219]
MKKLIFTGCLFAAIAAQSASKYADYESYTGFTVDSVPELPAKEVHPSLWFKKADVAALKAKKDQDKTAARFWAEVSGSEFLTLELPSVPGIDDGKKVIHKYYGTMSQIAAYNAFMFWMDASPEYQERAIAALERAYDGPIKELDPKEKSGPVDEIYMGTWLQNYAAAYDWMQPFLSPQQDEAIRKQLGDECNRVAINLYEWADRPHNHLSKPAWGVGSMALALSDDPRALGWLGMALAAANDNTRYFFSADGIYREGAHYMMFSWVNFLPFMWNYYNVSGVNQFENFQPLMEWGIAVRNGKGWLPNLEDSYIRPFPGHMAAGMYKEASSWLNSSAPLSDILMWNFETTDWSPFEAYLEKTGYNYSGASWDFAMSLVEYLTYDPTLGRAAPDVSPTVFLDGGQTIFRNSWAPSDPAVRYLLFQGVAEADNHHHAEHLSFILFAENQMMASDGGYSRGTYSGKERTEWYNQGIAHNVVLLNGEAPVDVAEGQTPLSKHRMDTTFFDFEEKEAPYPNGGLLRRAIAFPGESYFVVADIVTSPEKSEAVQVLHGGRGAMTGAGVSRVWNFSDDAYGPASKLYTWTFGAETIENDEGESTYLKDDYGVFPYIKAKAEGKEITFLQILFPASTDQAAPVVESSRNGNQIWATVSGEGMADVLMVQPGSDKVEFQGLETDASFCWVRTKDGKPVEFAVREATYLKKAGNILFQSAELRSEARRL